jgi:hypothetical protein
MRAGRFQSTGGPAIATDGETWKVHCPECGTDVPVEDGVSAVPCPRCDTVFRPGGLPTAAPATPASAAPYDPSDSLVGTTLGGWRLEHLVGRGGMGRVYRAKDAKDRVAALKVLPQELAEDPSFVRRFHREAKVMASLSHPHVVEVLGQGEDDGRLWFAMEFVRGETLRRRIEQGPLPPKEAARIAGEVASALSYAHGRGIVHRDLKPENVLLDEEGRVHLTDFGLLRLVRDEAMHEASTHLTRTDVILGTYEYMAPEQRRGAKDVDARADVFALGVILYEMLTGSLPLGRFTPASQVRTGVPAELDAVVNRALAPEPAARHASAAEFRDAVLAAAQAEAGSSWGKKLPAPLPEATSQDLADARGIVRHVDILSGLDKLLGLLLLLGCFGIVTLGTGVSTRLASLGGLPLLIGAIFFLRQGGRIAEMRPGARESQVTASIVLLFFPPVLTAMGIYGLLVMTGDRARRAFALGRDALAPSSGGPAPKPKPTPKPKPAPLPGPTVLHRVMLLAAVLWTLWMGLIVLDVNVMTPSHDARALLDVRQWTVFGLVTSGLLLVHAWWVRHRRRAVGISFTTMVFFLCSLGLLDRAIDEHPRPESHRGRGRRAARAEPAHDIPSVPPFRLEFRR